MLNNVMSINDRLKEIKKEVNFSGVICLKNDHDTALESASGYYNRADELTNNINTRFGIASGCKLFTSIGICQLVEKGVISFDTKLKDCLDIECPNFDEEITIHHLLSHTSGIPDYFDEDVMDNFEDLWKERPMYLLKSLKDFLPMFQNNKMMFKPGERFYYNNAAFILLGLIIEQQTKVSFTDYIETNIFKRSGMNHSGYFSMDKLPKNTALGYIGNEDGSWRTNTYSIPVKGGADGGAYITAPDMVKFWEALFNYKLLSKRTADLLLTPHVQQKDNEYYGYGIWITKKDESIFKYHVMGYDPGVSFKSSAYPNHGIKLVVISNKGGGPYQITEEVEKSLV